mmetsp:Transcript_17864/g.42523  ORF Transcript_17864/g.42523 Transcript_17864/m.42523 type:complete len:136 (-) Transcript_17864:68-475(-)
MRRLHAIETRSNSRSASRPTSRPETPTRERRYSGGALDTSIDRLRINPPNLVPNATPLTTPLGGLTGPTQFPPPSTSMILGAAFDMSSPPPTCHRPPSPVDQFLDNEVVSLPTLPDIEGTELPEVRFSNGTSAFA